MCADIDDSCKCKSCELARTAPNWLVEPHTYFADGWWVCYDRFARLRAMFRSEREAKGYIAQAEPAQPQRKRPPPGGGIC